MFQDYIQVPGVYYHETSAQGNHGSVYVKSPEALTELIVRLRDIEGELRDCGGPDDQDRDGPLKPERLYKGIYSYFFKTGVYAAQCRSCNETISALGCKTHQHRCEKCGEFTYEEFTPESWITFRFINSYRHPKLRGTLEGKFLKLEMTPEHRYMYLDYESIITCDPKIAIDKDWDTLKGADAYDFLYANQIYRTHYNEERPWEEDRCKHLDGKPLWELVDYQVEHYSLTLKGKAVRLFYGPSTGIWGKRPTDEEPRIEVKRSSDSRHNHYTGTSFEGKFYREGREKEMPFPASLVIYEVWHCPDDPKFAPFAELSF